MNKRVFYKNTAVMTGCSLVLRLMGIVFRIFISNRVGAEGMGLYQLVFSVYVLGTTFATSGIITAVTRLAAEHLAKGNPGAVVRLMRLCAFCCLLVGGLSALLLFGGAPYIGQLLGEPRAVSAIAYSGIALPFIGISSCLKGYFLAKRQAWPPCLAQMAEQAVRIGSIVWMLNQFWDGSLAGACLIIVLGDAFSETVACVYLMCAYRHNRCYALPKDQQTGVPLLRPMLQIALPLTAGRYLSTALRTVENFLVPAQLTHYTQSETASLAQFGAIKGMALPLIFFPSALLMTVSGLLIPELSDAHTLGQRRQVTHLTESSLQITLLGSILVGGLFTVLGKPLGLLLYNDSLAGTLLQVLGPLTPVMYLDSVVTGMLKGLGQQVHSLWFSVADSVVRIALILILLPHYGLGGFLFVMVVSNLMTGSLSTARLLTVSGAQMRWSRWIIRPSLAAGIAGGLCAILPFGGISYILIALLLFVGVYLVCMPLLGCFGKEDWKQLTARKG